MAGNVWQEYFLICQSRHNTSGTVLDSHYVSLHSNFIILSVLHLAYHRNGIRGLGIFYVSRLRKEKLHKNEGFKLSSG